VRARGLKPIVLKTLQAGCYVAPRAGAWIETFGIGAGEATGAESRPVRARGLKLIVVTMK